MEPREGDTVRYCGRDGVEHTYYPPGWYVMREKSHTIPLVIYEDRFWMAWDPYRDDENELCRECGVIPCVCAGSPNGW
jgi:hypothetical protein